MYSQFLEREKFMDERRINDIAQEVGFVKAAVIPVDDLVFVPEFRSFCEKNDCGNYGKNYGCPPYCGTPEEMENRVMKYSEAIVFQSRTLVDDIFDDREMKKIKKKHTQMTLKAMSSLKDVGLQMDGFPVMCGPCNYCDECMLGKEEPCIKEELRFSCLSAYCIDAQKMANRCDMEIQWNGDVASFFSVYIFNKR